MWEEGLRVAVRCMTEDAVHRVTRASTSRCRRATSCPKPRQKPHPPVWVACSRRDTIHLAAQKGIGALAFAFVDPEEAKYWVDDYYTTLGERGRADRRRGERRTSRASPTFMCHDDEDEALRRGLEGANFFGYSLAHYYVFGRHQPGAHRRVGRVPAARAPSTATTPKRSIAAAENEDRLGAKVVRGRASAGLRGAVGTPDQIRDYLRRYEECGVDQVIFCFQAGKNRHEHIMEALELFGREVLPEFNERDEKRARDKEQRLAPVIDAGHGPQAGRGPSAAADRRLRVPGDPAARWPTASATTTSTRCSTTSPSRPRSRPAASKGCSTSASE